MKVNHEHFQHIKGTYEDFYKFLYSKHHMFPVKDTGMGFWGVSVADEVFEVFQRIELHRFKHMLDMGSGDGKVVMIGSLFTRASGVEFDPWLVSVSHDIRDKMIHLPSMNRVTFHQGDFKEHDLSGYDVIFINPDREPHHIQTKLQEEFRGMLIVYGMHMPIVSLKRKDHFVVDGTPVTLYKVD